MNDYENKRIQKAQRYSELAKKNQQLADSAFSSSQKLSSVIPFGQPILVGHHSEARHRRDLDKINSQMRKSIDLTAKSEYYQNKANNLLNSNVISSDDPDAISKLKDKLASLEAKRTEIKSRPHESFELSNLSQNMRTVKQRIAYLENNKSVESPEIIFNDIKIVSDVQDNRVKMFFPSKPDESKRNDLKHHGFRWSPTNGCWQRMLSDWSIQIAKDIANR